MKYLKYFESKNEVVLNCEDILLDLNDTIGDGFNYKIIYDETDASICILITNKEEFTKSNIQNVTNHLSSYLLSIGYRKGEVTTNVVSTLYDEHFHSEDEYYYIMSFI